MAIRSSFCVTCQRDVQLPDGGPYTCPICSAALVDR